mmetsp:Transcript_22475/g.33698  ORF Transcript_22475/g.33698 Transcript_22475/m.33698 type:complete len:112 (+) Transcript_22475:751-1086(+)
MVVVKRLFVMQIVLVNGKSGRWKREKYPKPKKETTTSVVNNTDSTIVTLINASANWGNGGYLEAEGFNNTTGVDCNVSLSIGVPDVRGKKTASLWAIERRDDTVNERYDGK